MTALGNRRFFDNALAEEASRAREFGDDLCIALADIDHFKAINDNFGHVAGDMVLKLFAELLVMNIRSEDIAARIGGDEFAILFPATRLADASATVGRMRAQLENKQWEVAASGERIGAVTASFGVARLNAAEPAEELVRRADAKLYEAKSSGRNWIVGRRCGRERQRGGAVKSGAAGSQAMRVARRIRPSAMSWTRSGA